MAIPTFDLARSWFEKNAASYPDKEKRAAAYCKHFKLDEPLVIAKSGNPSNWTNSGRMLGSLQEGLGITPSVSVASKKTSSSDGTKRNSKLGALKELFQPAANDSSSINWEELGKQACAILFPAQVRRASNREAKKLERIQQQLKALSPEAKAKLLSQLDAQAQS